jgi:hypothetical protein
VLARLPAVSRVVASLLETILLCLPRSHPHWIRASRSRCGGLFPDTRRGGASATMSTGDDDHVSLLRVHVTGGAALPSPRGAGHQQHLADVEAYEATVTASPRRTSGGVRGLLRHMARGSGRRQQLDRAASAEQPPPTTPSQRQRERAGAGDDDELGDGAPPEWALLLIGCLLGLATGICVAAFNRGVSVCLFTELYLGVFDVDF